MPIVRIDLIEGKSKEYRAQVGDIVYQTLVMPIREWDQHRRDHDANASR